VNQGKEEMRMDSCPEEINVEAIMELEDQHGDQRLAIRCCGQLKYFNTQQKEKQLNNTDS
jgi:hypothetical protein